MHRAKARQGELSDGDWMLKKADAISGFLAQQRTRTHKAATKSAWGVAYKQMATEGEVLNKQLMQLMQQAGQRASDAAGELQDLVQYHQELAADTLTERLQVMAQVQDLSRLVHSMRCYGLSEIEQLEATVASLQQEIKWLGQDLQSNITALAAEADQLSQEIAADSKAALAGDDDNDSSSSGNLAGTVDQGLDDGVAGQTAADSTIHDPVNGTGVNDECDKVFITAVGGDSSNLAGNSSSNLPASKVAVAATLQDDELQQLISKHPLAPERLKQQVLEAYNALFQQHQQQVQQQMAAAPGQQAGADNSKYGGWSADDHALFVRLRGLAFKTASSSSRSGGGKGCSRAAVVEKLSLMMPGKSRRELEAHETWYTAANLHQRRIADLAGAWQRQRSSFLQDSAQMLQEAAGAAAAAVEAAATKLAWEAAGYALKDQLEELHLVKEQQQQELAEQQEAAAAAAAATAAAEHAAWLEQNAAKKAQVAHYKQQQQDQQAVAQQLADQAEAEAKAAAEAAIEAHKPAVAARQALTWDKMQQQIEQQKQRQMELEARQQRLAALAEAFAPHVARDPQRLLQPTAASAAAAEAQSVEGQISAGAAFRPVHGYTTAQVVSDPRFRVVEALREAGLTSGTAKGYVQKVFTNLQPATAARRGNLTTGQLEAFQARNAG